MTSTYSSAAGTTNDSTPKSRLWTGRVLWFLTVPLLFLDAGMHLANPPFVAKAFIEGGLSPSVAVPLGLTMLICLALYLVPRTAILGAALITGYLGGAMATDLGIGHPAAFPFVLGLFIWLSLYCRDARLRALAASTFRGEF